MGIGEYFLDSLFADIDALALVAGIHSEPDGRLHCTLAKRFPFAGYYEVRDNIATVAREAALASGVGLFDPK